MAGSFRRAETRFLIPIPLRALPVVQQTTDLCIQTVNQILANRMTPATHITERDEIRSAEQGFLYKRRTAVCQMTPVTQKDGRCRHRFAC